MVRISKQEIFNYSAPAQNSAQAAASSSGSIWNSANYGVQESEQTPKTPAEINNTIVKAIKNKDVKTLMLECENMTGPQLNKVAELYKKQTGQSLVAAIKDNPAFTKQTGHIEQTLRSKGVKGSYSYNEFLAYDLFNELNGSDTQKIDNLIKNSIYRVNVRDVCTKYQMLAKTKGETAATLDERKLIGKFLVNHKKLKVNGLRDETLFQGILNNKALSLDKKREYLTFLTNNYIEYAQKKNIPQDKINVFKKRTDMYIKECTAVNDGGVNNADRIEKALGDLLGY